MRWLSWTFVFCALAPAASGVVVASSGLDDKDIKLSGCLVSGERGGYLLTNGPSEPAWQKTTDAAVVPGAIGTTGSFATVLYWLKENDDLKEHAGHRVEVEGKLKGPLQDGQIKIDRKDKWTEITVKAAGESLKAQVPHSSVFPVSTRESDTRMNVLVRKVDVDHVRMLAAACDP